VADLVNPDDIVNYARTWVGARWKHQGRGEGSDRGIDCVGLLVRIAENFGLECTDIKGYRRTPGNEFLSHIEQFSDPAIHLGPLHGAIGIFNDSVMPCHTGVFAVARDGSVSVVHSEASNKRRCHEQPFNIGRPPLRGNLVDIRLFRGVDYNVR
jgi:hypothetical protein